MNVSEKVNKVSNKQWICYTGYYISMKTSFAMIGVAFYKRNNNKEKFEKSKKSKRQIIDMLQGSFSFTKLNLTRVETALLLQFF